MYVDYYYTLNNSTIVDPVLEISTDTKVVSSKEQIIMIAKTLNANESELLEMWMAARIVAIAESDIDIAPAAIKLVGETLKIDQQ